MLVRSWHTQVGSAFHCRGCVGHERGVLISRARILIPSSRCFSYLLDLKNSGNFEISPFPSSLPGNTVVKTTAILGVSLSQANHPCKRFRTSSSTGNHVKLFYLVESYKHAIASTWWPMLAIHSSVALIAADVKSELNSASALKWRLDRSSDSSLIIFSRRYLRTVI